MSSSPDGEPGDPSSPAPLPPEPVDVVVVGSGVAGLSAALEFSRLARGLSVLLLTRGALGGHGASPLAQGGVAAAVAHGDSPELHALDTEAAAAGLARRELVDILTGEGPERVRELIRLGARFDRSSSGTLALGLEGAHSRHRILHAMGDRTGAEVTRALRTAVRGADGVGIHEHTEVIDLLTGTGGVEGVLVRDPSGVLRPVRARITLLATGGAGRIYLRTTSPPGLTGDGLAMAARAGAIVRDVEFMQFHPTALNVDRDPLPLVTEALRGAGARLVDRSGRPVMDPDEGDELASRDVVARSLWERIRRGTPVFLDARGELGASMAERFPGVHHLCRTHGIDPEHELIPVTPAAHYHMGGIAVDRDGQSSVAGLRAVGEVASSGVHGANRLASNSLLEGLVFGPRVARSIVVELSEKEGPGEVPVAGRTAAGTVGSGSPPPDGVPHPSPDSRPPLRPLTPAEVRRIRTLLWERVGLVRDGEGLRSALAELEALEGELAPLVPERERGLLLVARMVTHAALLREESRGSHFRSDFPGERPGRPLHSLLGLDPVSGRIRGELAADGPGGPALRAAAGDPLR